jgi:uncharacterized protein
VKSIKEDALQVADRSPGMAGESQLRFRCHSGLSCFTNCCRDVNIFLTPYDVLRMKNRLGVSSGDFLERFTVTVIPETSGFPLSLLKMEEDRDKACPFVGRNGCSIYEDRPWSCRMYPLDREGESFRIVANPGACLGLGEDGSGTVIDYLQTQQVSRYEEMETLLKRISSNPRLSKEKIENPRVQEMCRMAMYDLDRFRRFVLESRFLDIFEVDKDVAKRIREDDEELMKLALRWLEFGLVAGEGMRIREDVLKERVAYNDGPRIGQG